MKDNATLERIKGLVYDTLKKEKVSTIDGVIKSLAGSTDLTDADNLEKDVEKALSSLVSDGVIKANNNGTYQVDLKKEVLNLLSDKYDAVSFEVLRDDLYLNTVEEIRELQTVLNELINSYDIYLTKKDKFILLEKMSNFVVGIMDVKDKGFGFLLQSEGKDIHIDKRSMNGALDGDKVLVEVLGTNPQNPEGKVLKVLERNKKNIVGEVKVVKSKKVFVTKEKKYQNVTISINQNDLNKCVEGEIIAVTIDNENSSPNHYNATFKARIGHKDEPGMDIKQLAARYDVFEEFPAEAMEQAESLPTEVEEKDLLGRRDLRDKMIFTIDGKDTKDIDDAISLEYTEDGKYVLGVHIADVSYYIPENSPLDVEALNRATSNYPADKVIPQLPHIISNGICSLNEGVDRLTITCEMVIGWDGRVEASEVYPSVIRSNKKMNYTDCNTILTGEIPEGYEPFADKLLEMVECHKLIRAERQRRGAMDFDTVEPKFVFDENHHVIDIIARERGEFEKVIEDFMIAANESVGREFQMYGEWGLPTIYRVHDVPNIDKVQKFIAYCNMAGEHIVGKFKTVEHAKIFQKLLKQIKATGEDREIIMKMAIRSMAKACYQKENIGHFGLASDCYLHFTSPIRRYPDLQVHRLLRIYFFNGLANDDKVVNYWDNHLDAIAKQSSERERNADDLERAADDMFMADYMEDHIGEEYEARVSGVQGFGIFVQLPNRVEGLLKFEEMENDIYDYDKDSDCVIARNTKKIYRAGTKIKVRCIAASKEASQIDFAQVVEEEQEQKRSR
jgi:ribonuclease R